MESRRQLKVEEQVKRIVGAILSRGAKDPRIGFVSVVTVEVTPDLKLAKVFISAFGKEEEVVKTFEGLNSARGYIQRELGSQMRSRYTPVISFHRDTSIAYGAHIESVIKELKEKDDWPRNEETTNNQ